jgi:hypothetical protein
MAGTFITSDAFSTSFLRSAQTVNIANGIPSRRRNNVPLFSDRYNGGENDGNTWTSSDDSDSGEKGQEDWEETMSKRKDGTLWSAFDSTSNNEKDDESVSVGNTSSSSPDEKFDDGEAWLDTIASISADEVNFMNTEADRADKVRQMQEWGFNAESISSTLGVNTDDSAEIDPENEMLEKFKEETAKTGFGMYLDDDIDLQTVESHTMVECDDETGEPIRTQMVYVDEHTCIGCTHCAGVSHSLADSHRVLHSLSLTSSQYHDPVANIKGGSVDLFHGG